jgi:tripartite-type tricarboxylate transporter receptor subunit TctC
VRPIRFIVPSAPGGTPDVISRVLASELSRQMGQQVVVDNRVGASGAIGMHMLARAVPDGHTIGYAPVSALTVNPHLAKLPYDSEKDLQMVAQLVFGLHILTVTPSLPVKSVQELIDHARNNPGKLSYASSGSGSTQHVGMELFKLMTGTQLLHVPYKAIQQAITEVIGGRVHVVFDNLASMTPHVRSGRVRALAVTSPKRSSAFPDLPTISEAGVPGFEVTTLERRHRAGRRAEGHRRQAQCGNKHSTQIAGDEGQHRHARLRAGRRQPGAIHRVRKEGIREMGRRGQAHRRESRLIRLPSHGEVDLA